MRRVGAKTMPSWAVILLIVAVVIGLLVYFELTFGFLFGEDGLFKNVSAFTPSLKDFDEDYTITFENVSVRFDDRDHRIEVDGHPNGATVTYDIGNEFHEVGVYVITATIEMEGFKTKTMTATLEIYDAYVVTFRYQCGIYAGQYEREVKVGEAFNTDNLPDVPQYDGYVGEWDIIDWKENGFEVTENMVINAIYTKIGE